MNEHSYIKAVTRHLTEVNYKWKINDSYAGGTPDMFLEGISQDLWVEWKYIKPFPKRDTTVIDLTNTKYLSALQQKWLVRRHHARGDVAVIAGSEYGGVVFFGLEWQRPITAGKFKDMCRKHPAVACELLKMVGTV